MNWTAAETIIRTHIETQWAISEFNHIPLVFENEDETESDFYMGLNIEGTIATKTIYGSVGKRSSIESGLVFMHCFVPIKSGKAAATGPVVAMMGILELQTLSSTIDFYGANPPTPVHYGIDELDREIPMQQPAGSYYRCSSSVPFHIRDVR